jgi:hypothetical protein
MTPAIQKVTAAVVNQRVAGSSPAGERGFQQHAKVAEATFSFLPADFE